jgi:Leucine-rich repeat (LRR) protein
MFKDTLQRINWTSLQRLSLPSMNLTGPIGPLAYYLPQLTMLDLSNNQLSGVLPPDLSGAYSSLLHVDLSGNALYGAFLCGIDVAASSMSAAW